MKKLDRFLVFFILVTFFSTFFLVSPTFATDSSNVVETTFFGNINDEGDGCGVFTILNLVVDILSIGVGVLGVIGISVAGIQYLSSAGKEEQARKSRTRIFQIIIGLALYALMYTGINWLTPGGKLNTGSSCSTIDDKQLAKMRAAENKAKQAQQKSSSSKSTNKKATNAQDTKSYNQCMKKAAKVVRDKICKLKTPAERISKTAKLLAGSGSSANSTYKNAMKQAKSNMPGGCESYGQACNTYVATVLRASGVDLKVPGQESKKGNNTRVLYDYLVSSKNWKKISNDPKKSRDGDVVVKPRDANGSGGHITITVKNSKGKLVTAHASNCGFYPVLSNSIYTGYSGTPTVFRYVGS